MKQGPTGKYSGFPVGQSVTGGTKTLTRQVHKTAQLASLQRQVL